MIICFWEQEHKVSTMALKQKDQGYNFKAHDSRKQIMDFFGSDSFND